jgi:hypothetical protein
LRLKLARLLRGFIYFEGGDLYLLILLCGEPNRFIETENRSLPAAKPYGGTHAGEQPARSSHKHVRNILLSQIQALYAHALGGRCFCEVEKYRDPKS